MEHATKLFKDLTENNVQYLICGGLAVNIYGVPRLTADIDLLVDFEEKNIMAFEKVVGSLYYQPRLPFPISSLLDKSKRSEYIKEKNLIAFSYYNVMANFMNVDVLIDVPITFSEMWAQKETRQIDEKNIYLISLGHLILMKQYANRMQDQQDILMLSEIYRQK